MKTVKQILFFLVCLVPFLGLAQNWAAADSGVLPLWTNPKFMYVDTLEDRLYLGGEFENSKGKIVSQLMYYKNGKIYNLDTTILPPNTGKTYSMARYKGELYVGGEFVRIGKKPVTTYSIAKLVNDTFVTVNNVKRYVGQSRLRFMLEYKGKLILGFQGDSLAGIKSNGILAFDGKNFEPMGGGVLDIGNDANVLSLVFFKGKLFAGGNFSDRTNINTTDYKTTNFQVWNDAKQVWEIVDGWKGGHISEVDELIVFQNDLYIMGGWKDFDNAIGNDIVRFDGTYFYSIGKGTGRYGIGNAVIHKNELYVCGYFRELDGMKVYGIAKWDGIKWCRLSKDIFTRGGQTYGIEDVAFYNDTLFVYGGFQEISGDSISNFSKWIGDSNMADLCAPKARQDTVNYNLSVTDFHKNSLKCKVYPNPTSGTIILELERINRNQKLKLLNLKGEVLIWGNISQSSSNIDLNWLDNGVYILEIESDKGKTVKRIIKQ